MNRFWHWLTNNWLLLVVLFVGASCRFYRLRDLTTFGGDQGVDYQIAAKMIATGRPTLLGPVTHVGVYLGPLYYYLLVPFFLLFRFDPIAAPFMFALFGTATVGLVFILAKIIFRRDIVAFFTAILYAVSPVILESSRAPSQPHLIPFFATLLLISIIRIIEKHDRWWDWMAIGISLGSAIQFHFLTFPLYIFFTVIMMLLFITRKHERKKLSLLLVSCFLFLVVLIFPWFLFELRHQFFITHQIIAYLQSGDIGFSPAAYLERVLDLIWFSFDRLIGQGNQFVTAAAIIFAVSGMLSRKTTLLMLVLYFGVNILGLSLYISPFSNHYISSLYPVVILLTAVGVYRLLGNKLWLLAFAFIIIFSFSKNDFNRTYGYTMPTGVTTSSIQRASNMIAGDMKKQDGNFNVVNTLDGDTRANPYRYVLTYGEKTVPLGPEDYPRADYLYVISRERSEELLKDQRWELLSFPVGEIKNLGTVSQDIQLYSWHSGVGEGKDLRR